MSTVDVDVAIVGYGPVGSVLAILLGQRGRSTVVLERWPSAYPLPRAVHFDHEVGRILQACGIGPAVREISEPTHVYEWRNGEGTTLLRFGRVGDTGSGWPESSMFNQPALEALLDAQARSFPTVDVRRGVEVVGLEQSADGVTLRDAGGGEVRARYVVGCDGANSTVRALVDAPMHDLGFFFDWLIVDVVPHEARVWEPENLQVCDPARPTTVISGGPGRRRWEFMALPDERIEDLNDEAVAWSLLAPWDITPANATLERHAVYTFRARYAERWRTDRVLLAGDAAHLTPPFAGQGMCAGLRDAMNLAWKLDLVLDGAADDALLDTYQEERLPHARSMIELAIELGKVICVPDPAEAAARDAAMAAMVGDEPSAIPPLPTLASEAIGDSPGAGELFVQGTLDGRPLDDIVGHGWRLLTLDAEPAALDDETAAWFAGIGGAVVALDAPDDDLAAWFAAHDATWVLERPDFAVFGTAEDATGAAALVQDLRRRLARRPETAGAHA